MKKSGESAPQNDGRELELPDWSDMDSSSGRLDSDAAFRLCEEYSAWFSESAARWRLARGEKCLVEFTL